MHQRKEASSQLVLEPQVKSQASNAEKKEQSRPVNLLTDLWKSHSLMDQKKSQHPLLLQRKEASSQLVQEPQVKSQASIAEKLELSRPVSLLTDPWKSHLLKDPSATAPMDNQESTVKPQLRDKPEKLQKNPLHRLDITFQLAPTETQLIVNQLALNL